MANPSKTYPVTDVKALAAKVKSLGGPQLDPTAETGHATADGVTLSWVIAGPTVTVTIQKKPFWMSEGMVWDHVDAVFA